MPKMKTKSGAKKRFHLTAKGKVRIKPAGMRHGMSKRTQQMKRTARHSKIMNDSDAHNVKKFFLPYA